jgi:hypothetical protein
VQRNPGESLCDTSFKLLLRQRRLPELDTLVQFDKSMENANKFTHTFSDDPEIVRVSISQIESCLYLLLCFSKRVK